MNDGPMPVWLVYDLCDCGEPNCYGRVDIEVFTSKQTAKQAAEVRSKQWNGIPGRYDMHMEEVMVSTKVRKY